MTTASDDKKEIAISIPWASAWWRYPWVVVGLCADIEGMGREVVGCTSIAERHHGAQCALPLRSERRRRGGADEVLSWCGGALRVGEVESAGHGLETESTGVKVAVFACASATHAVAG